MFSGFSEKTSEFMWDLAFNNERPWFNAHRQEFEDYLNTPFKALAHDTYEALSRMCPGTRFSAHVSRIYRDARRLFGRGPYKEKLWFSFKADSTDDDGPVFWFEIGASEYAYGLGFWGIPSILEKYRAAIDANPAAFERMVNRLARLGFSPEGEEYKRPKGSYGKPISLWYNRKHPGIICCKDFGGDLFSPELPEILAKEYMKMMPFCDFLNALYHQQD